MNKREWMLQAAMVVPQWDTHAASDHADRLSAIYDAVCAASPIEVERDWIEHDGDASKAPKEWEYVQARMRDGGILAATAGEFPWYHSGSAMDVIAWRAFF